MDDPDDIRRRGEILAWICAAFFFVTAAVGPIVVVFEVGWVALNLALTAVGMAVYALGFVLARRGRVDEAALLTTVTISLCIFVMTFGVGGLNGFHFLGTMMPLLVSLVARRSLVVPVVVVNVLAVLVLAGLGVPVAVEQTGAFLPALLLTHLCTGAVAWFYSSQNTHAYRQVVEARDGLQRALVEVSNADRAKSSFLANMSHELRTPLNAIMGYTELVQEELEDAGRPSDDLDRVRTASVHLLALIDQVLDLSKVEAGRLELVLEEVDLSSLVDELASTGRTLAAKRGNTFVLDAPVLEERHRLDRMRVRQIVLNLLSNAAKFTTEGTITLRVAAGGDLRFTVEDTGVGMDAAVLERVFEPFVQADASTSRRFGGTGLGLALSRRLAELHGGALTATSEPGGGSVFTVQFPRASDPGCTGDSRERLPDPS